MLVADRAVLRGHGDSELARHLRECDACRAIARGIEQDTALLASMVPADVDRSTATAPRRRRTWTALAIGTLPIAANIVIAVLFQQRSNTVAPVIDTTSPNERIAMRSVSVNVAPGQTATVIRTQDPKVTIVWISPGGTQ
jgi:hypothetical protein